MISQYEKKVNIIIESLSEFSFSGFHTAMNKEVKRKTSKQDVYQLFDDTVSKLNSVGKIATATAYKNASQSLKRYRSKLNFTQVNIAFLKDYDSKVGCAFDKYFLLLFYLLTKSISRDFIKTSKTII